MAHVHGTQFLLGKVHFKIELSEESPEPTAKVSGATTSAVPLKPESTGNRPGGPRVRKRKKRSSRTWCACI